MEAIIMEVMVVMDKSRLVDMEAMLVMVRSPLVETVGTLLNDL